MTVIAVVKRDSSVLEVIKAAFEGEGFETHAYADGADALAAFKARPPDVAMIERELPGLDGLEVLRRLRAFCDIPVVMESADWSGHEAEALALGVDDLIAPSVFWNMMLDRLQTALRRREPPTTDSPRLIERGPLILDPDRCVCSWKGAPVALTITSFRVLEALAEAPGRTRSRQSLISAAFGEVSGGDAADASRVLACEIEQIQTRFRAVDPEFDAIKQIRNFGFRFERFIDESLGEARPTVVAVVNDDYNFLRNMLDTLEPEGFDVRTYADGVEALAAFQENLPDIAMINYVMPRMNGLELVKRLRAFSDIPVIIDSVCCREDVVCEYLIRNLSIDDFIQMPAPPSLIVDSLRAVLRRHAAPIEGQDADPEAAPRLERGPLIMDPARSVCSWKGELIALSVTEFRMLEALARRPGFVRSRDQLGDAAYGDDIYVSDRAIDSHVKRIRALIRRIDPEFDAIEQLYGVGYRYKES